MARRMLAWLGLLILGYLLLAVIIEAGRWVYAYAMVSNAARWGVRYAIMGEYNDAYCEEAGRQLGYLDADSFASDPFDCRVPLEYQDTLELSWDWEGAFALQNELQDRARLFHIRDMALRGAGGLLVNSDPAVTGDYAAYLSTHDPQQLGRPDRPGYFHVGICNQRLRDAESRRDFAWRYVDSAWFPLCYSPTDGEWVDDPGNPGDIAMVSVAYVHPTILPPMNWLWPTVKVRISREAGVEIFRIVGHYSVPSQIGDSPTKTPASVTATP